jgi:uncharacterized protein CbrC (UPF0167 family)
MSKFKNTFFRLLSEEIDEKLTPGEITPETDANAFKGSFEDPAMADEFNTDTSVPGYSQKYAEQAKQWITKINEFCEWLNGTDSNSLNKQLISMDKANSPFEGISNEAKKITGIARDLASLAEGVKGVILTIDKRQRDIGQSQEQF